MNNDIPRMGCGFSSESRGELFSADQLLVLDAIDKTIPSLSVLGSLSIIVCWLCFKDLRRFAFRLVVFMSIADIGAALSTMPNIKDSACFSCLVQAWCASFFGCAEVFWTACISHCLLKIIRHHDLDVQRFEPRYHTICWGISALLALLPLPFQAYGSDEGMCWILSDYAFFRFAQFYIPLWVVIGYNSVTYYKVFSTLKLIFGSSRNEDQAQEVKKVFWRLGLYPVILVVCWFFASINRIQNSIDPAHPVFELYVLHRLLANFQGFLNAIAYGLNPAVRSKLGEVVCRSQTRDATDHIELAKSHTGVHATDAEAANSEDADRTPPHNPAPTA